LVERRASGTVQDERFDAFRDVREDQFHAKFHAMMDPVIYTFHKIVALPESQRFAHLLPVAPRSF
jgi:hypothetical protein